MIADNTLERPLSITFLSGLLYFFVFASFLNFLRQFQSNEPINLISLISVLYLGVVAFSLWNLMPWGYYATLVYFSIVYLWFIINLLNYNIVEVLDGLFFVTLIYLILVVYLIQKQDLFKKRHVP